MFRFLIRLAAPFAAILLASRLLPGGVIVESYTAAAIFAVALSVLNAVVRPLVELLSMPLTCLTLGLFHFVLNAAFFAAAAWLVPGIQVDGFVSALLGSLVVSGVGLAASLLTREGDKRRD
jgi:putative membrane protein